MADLVLQNIGKSFGNVPVLKDISLHVKEGEFTVLLGPSGCGKSTILRIIAGLDDPTNGSVIIDGTTVNHYPPGDRDIAMVFQQYALYPHLTVRKNLAFALTIRKMPQPTIHARIRETADLLEIHDLLDRFPKELSGGQRQRVAMGRAIVRKPKLFLFDEPLSNLDARLRTSLRVELKRLHQRLGVTIMYVTHDQVEAMTLGQKIVVLKQGSIQQVGSPEQVYHHPKNLFVAGFIGNPSMNLFQGTLLKKNDVPYFQTSQEFLQLPSYPFPSDISDIQIGIRPEDILLEPSKVPTSTLSGVVDVIENLGSDLLIYANVLGQSVIIRTSPTHIMKPGETIPLYFPHQQLHIFFKGARVP